MIRKLLFLFVINSPALLFGQQISIIPQPVSLQAGSGSFVIDNNTSLQFNAANKELKAAADFFTGYIKDISGKSLLQNAQKSKRIELRLAKTTGIGVEGYLLDVSPVAIVVTANTKAGIVYAMQTLFQTLPAVRTNAPLAGFLHGRTRLV